MGLDDGKSIYYFDGMTRAVKIPFGASMSPPLARKVQEHFAKSKPFTALTTLEKAIVTGVVEGLSHKMIVTRLNISPGIIPQQIKNIYTKLQAHSKV